MKIRMDEDKRRVLQEIGYEIRPNCGMCLHGMFKTGRWWGECGLHTYDHEKHTEATRQLSIHRYGHCDQVQTAVINRFTFAGFTDFVVDG